MVDYGSPVSVFTTMWLAFSLGNQYTSKPCPAVGSTAQKRVWPLSASTCNLLLVGSRLTLGRASLDRLGTAPSTVEGRARQRTLSN